MLASRLSAAYLRIDTIEQALRDLCSVDVHGEGYGMAYRLAADNLKAGVSVIADSCNPIELTRSTWNRVAIDTNARFANIEVVCSDQREHKTRIETRPLTIPGLKLPTWSEVQHREYESWTTERIVIDTAGRGAGTCFDELLLRLADVS
jgi:predicted kinase